MQTLHISAAPPFHAPSPASAEPGLMLLGPSTAMAHLWSQIRHLAPHIRTVLLTGPPDAGQEAVARLLLDLSPHPQRPFLALRDREDEERFLHANGANILSPELFLFVPEIGQLSSMTQACLLRTLRVRRNRGLTVVASSSEDLRSLASVGRVSAELAQLLGTVRIEVPALKDRVEDVPMLLCHLLAGRFRAQQEVTPQISDELLRAAMQHLWPGNLRELAEVVETLAARSSDASGPQGRSHPLSAEDLMRSLASVQGSKREALAPIRMIKLDTVMQEHIYAVLRGCRGNKLKAAEILGVSRSTLYRMLAAAAQNLPLPLAS